MLKYENRKKKLNEFPILGNLPVKIDFKLLHKLLKFRSYSDSMEQINFSYWLEEWINNNISDVIVKRDFFNNLFITKGDSDLYPCMVAHMDINQSKIDDVHILNNGKWIIGIDNQNGMQCGLGADDSVGVYAALEMLRNFDNLKVFFSTDEEIGGIGSNRADKSWFGDCTMLIQLDRNAYAGSELITHTNGIDICSKDFVRTISDIMEKYNYFESQGSYTDVGVLKESTEVDCIAFNSCAAYFDEHSDEEVIYIPALVNALNFTYDVISEHGYKKWKHKVTNKSYSYDKWYLDINGKWKKEQECINGYDYICKNDVPDDIIAENLSQNICPCCESEDLYEDIDRMFYCVKCESYWNIPEFYKEYPKEYDNFF